MTKYLNPSFSVHLGSENYRANFDAIFGPKPQEPFPPAPSATELDTCSISTADQVDDFMDFYCLPPEAEDDLYVIADTAAYEASLHRQVIEFHQVYGQPIAATPHVPDNDTVALRLRLVVEETLELLTAHGIMCADIEEELFRRIDDHRREGFKVDLVEAADAMGDLDYVVEGMRITYGIDGGPIAETIHASNMSKLGEDGLPIRDDNGKVRKGPHFFEPQIEAALLEQGWVKA